MKYINNSYIKFINSNFQFIVLFVQILTSWKSKRSYVCCVWPYSNSIYISNLVSDAWSQKFCLYFNSRRPYKSMEKFLKDTISLGFSCPKVYHVSYFINNPESASITLLVSTNEQSVVIGREYNNTMSVTIFLILWIIFQNYFALLTLGTGKNKFRRKDNVVNISGNL